MKEDEGSVLRRKIVMCASAGRRKAPSAPRAKTRLSPADTFTAGNSNSETRWTFNSLSMSSILENFKKQSIISRISLGSPSCDATVIGPFDHIWLDIFRKQQREVIRCINSGHVFNAIYHVNFGASL
jgi:hypothetical protein